MLLLVACLFILLPLSTLAEVPPRPTTAGFVFDYQQVIDDDIEKEINDFAYKLQQQGIMELFIVTVPTIGNLEPYEYGVELFRQWGIGDQHKNNGMVIFATTDMGSENNKVRIATGYGLEGDYPDGRTGELLDEYMMPYLSEGDYTTAFAKVVEALRLQEGIEHTWQQEEIFAEEEMSLSESILSWGFLVVMLSVCLVLIGLFFHRLFRFIQGVYFNAVEKKTGREIRTARYKAYMKRKKEKAMKTRAKQGLYGDSYSSDSGSNDSYSGSGGNSGGGGSDRSF